MAGTHRLIALWLANQLYKTRDYLDVKEYDLAKIKDLDQFGQWRKDEFIFQKIKGSDVGEPYKEFDIEKYQKGFDNQFTAEYADYQFPTNFQNSEVCSFLGVHRQR